ELRARQGQPGLHEARQPVGAAGDHREARRGGRARPVGRARPRAGPADAAGLPRRRGRPRGRPV
ncbi:MAG: Aerobic cobaltochelatase CobN subunit, partial [uncultured Friedmanniella sp.]